MSEGRKIRILYLPNGVHLYGDNRSLLGTISQLAGRVEILVGVTGKGLLTQELDRLGVPYVIVGSVMSPALLYSYRHYSWAYRLKRQLSFLWRYARTSVALSRAIRSFAPDILHANNSHVYSGAIMARRFGLPCVWHIREYTTLDHHAIFPNQSFFDASRKTSHCIAITKGIFDHFCMTEGKDVQIYNGVCSERDVQPCLESKQRYFLYLGRIVSTKGVTDMLEAFAFFCRDNTDVRLVIAGDGPEDYLTELRERIRVWQIEDRVEFAGFRKDIGNLIRPALALIVPSLFEAMGRTTAEAMLAGCYVIGRNTAGTKELLESQQCGTLFDTVPDLTAAMHKVVNMPPSELTGHVLRVQESARRVYTNERNADRILEFYHQILNRK